MSTGTTTAESSMATDKTKATPNGTINSAEFGHRHPTEVEKRHPSQHQDPPPQHPTPNEARTITASEPYGIDYLAHC